MTAKDLKRTPHHPAKREDAWWYEENDGVYVVLEASRDTRKGDVANTVKIKWSSLRAALARKDKGSERLPLINMEKP